MAKEEKKKVIAPAEEDDDVEDPKDKKPDEEEEDEDLDDESEEEEEDDELLDEEENDELDEEIEAEKKRGKPDPKKAHERIKKGKDKPDEEDEDEDDDDQPISRREAREIAEATRKEAQETRASDIARRLVGGGKNADKETELVVLKWKNRSFPEGMTLTEQVEEAFAISHRKRLISQRNEALRGLKNRDNINRNGAQGHRDNQRSPSKDKPKGMSQQDIAAIESSGFKWNANNARFEKKLKNGNMLVKLPGKSVETVKA